MVVLLQVDKLVSLICVYRRTSIIRTPLGTERFASVQITEFVKISKVKNDKWA